jgi:hypothetical protein
LLLFALSFHMAVPFSNDTVPVSRPKENAPARGAFPEDKKPV